MSTVKHKVNSAFYPHNHSYYSFLDGYASPREYFERAREIGLKGFAITEHGNVFSQVYFDEIKHEYPDIKLVYGCEFYECDDIEIKDKNNKYYHLVVLAKNDKGRVAINKLVRLSRKGFYNKKRIDWNMFKEIDTSNVIVTSACLASRLSREKDFDKCVEFINKYKKIFPYFYLEIQPHDFDIQEEYNKKLIKLSKATNTPFLIATDSHFAKKEDKEFQDIHAKINSKRDDSEKNEIYTYCYMQSIDEVHDVLDKQIGYENVEKGLQESLDLLDLIDEVDVPWQEKATLPKFPFPNGFTSEYEYLKHLIFDIGFKNKHINKALVNYDVYYNRALHELEIIQQMDFVGYFLIEWEFVNWAKNNGIMVGAGRGSAAGSLVNYLLNVTEIDPIKFGLIFERFLNPERISLPDIDADFSNKEKVIKHLIELYGEENVAQVCNFSYITPLMAIKDVGKVLGLNLKERELIANKYFQDNTWEECMSKNPTLYDEYPQYHELFRIASHISNRPRHVSIHAGGVVIGTSSLDNYIAIDLGKKGEQIISVDKKKCEPLGLVKYDILGLNNLNIIVHALELAGIDYWEINIDNPNFLNDKKTFELICKGLNNAVFQLEGVETQELISQIQPQNVLEIGDITSLIRPDCAPMRQPYLDHKLKNIPIPYIHEDMKEITKETFGQLIYQEQTMDVVRKFGGRSMGGADIFRKAIGAKDVAKVQQEAHKLYQEIIDNGYDEEVAKQISDMLAKGGGYGFNKSHAVSYSVISMQIAYLKAHYPLQFFTALFMSVVNEDKSNYGMLSKYIADACDNFDIAIKPPDINKSGYEFTCNSENNEILFGLGSIKGIGKEVVDNIFDVREITSPSDFLKKITKKDVVITLVKSGALPIKDKRGFLLHYAKHLYKPLPYKEYKPVKTVNLQKALVDYDLDLYPIKDKEERLRLFNKVKEEEHNGIKKQKYIEQQKQKYIDNIKLFEEKYLQDEFMWEFDTLSIFLTNDPLKISYKYTIPWDEVDCGGYGVLLCVISDRKKKKDRNGNHYAQTQLYTPFGMLNGVCWSNVFSQNEELVKRGNCVAILYTKNDEKNLVIDDIKTYDKWLRDKNIFDEVLGDEQNGRYNKR